MFTGNGWRSISNSWWPIQIDIATFWNEFWDAGSVFRWTIFPIAGIYATIKYLVNANGLGEKETTTWLKRHPQDIIKTTDRKRHTKNTHTLALFRLYYSMWMFQMFQERKSYILLFKCIACKRPMGEKSIHQTAEKLLFDQMDLMYSEHKPEIYLQCEVTNRRQRTVSYNGSM